MGKFTNWLFGNDDNRKIKNEVQEAEVDITQDTRIVWNDDEYSASSISEELALSIPAFSSGVDLVASNIGYLPVKLYKMENGEKVEIKDDYRVDMLNRSNSLFDSSFNLMYSITKNLILYGTAYVYIEKGNRNNIDNIFYLHYKDVSPQLIRVGKSYDYKFSFSFFQEFKTVSSDQMMVIAKDVKRSTDITGIGVLEKNAKALNLALEEMNNSSNALNNKLPAYLSTPNSLSPKAKDNIRSSFRGLAKSNEVPIFEEGLSYNVVSFNPEELELLNARKYSAEIVAQILGIPFTYLVSSASSYATSSEESTRFVKSLMPYITVIQQGFERFLLTEKEKRAGYFFELDTKQLLKASVSEMNEYLSKQVNVGALSPNEMRVQLGLPKVEGLDYYQVQVNTYQVIDGKITLPSQQDVDLVEQQEENKDNVDNKKDEEKNKLEEE